MSRTILNYPDGIAGIALLLMRLSCSLAVWSVATSLDPDLSGPVAIAAAALLSLALIAGAFTRLASTLLLTATAAGLLTAAGGALLFLLSFAAAAAALAIMGPGAFSVDAHRYGRRVITIAPRPPKGGGDT